MAIIKLDPTGSGAIDPIVFGGANGNVRAYPSGSDNVAIDYNDGSNICIEHWQNYRDADGNPFQSREAVPQYVKANFKKASGGPGGDVNWSSITDKPAGIGPKYYMTQAEYDALIDTDPLADYIIESE